MKRIVVVAALAGVLAAAGPGFAPAQAQNGVRISYEEPTKNPNLRRYYETLRKRKVLETLQFFLSPLKLGAGKTLSIRTAECGGPYAPYQGDGQVTICYEYVDLIDSVLPGASTLRSPDPDAPGLFKNLGRIGTVLVTRAMAAEGPFVEQALHETALGVFDLLELPVWGREDDAADYLAAFMMLQFGTDVARKTVYGTAYFLNQLDLLDRSVLGNNEYVGSGRPTIRQRYYNVLCIALGSDPIEFSTFIPVGRAAALTDLPIGRLESCTQADQLDTARRNAGSDYDRVARAFAELIWPNHVDHDQAAKVRATLHWLPDQ